ncbi:MAG: hypothetical protein AABZ56_05935 [Bacteroidota bacterium]
MKISLLFIKAIVLVLILLVLICGVLNDLRAQTYQLEMGTNVTSFQFRNSEGTDIDFLKNGSGSSFKLGVEYKLIDTTKDISSSSRKFIYFSQKPRIASLLSMFHIDFQVEANQLNAVGDNQSIPFSYQTNFVGLSGGLGFNSPQIKQWSLNLQSKISGHKIIQGNQEVGNQFIDLTHDSQFSPIQLFAGLGIQLQKKVNENLVLFLNFQRMQTFHREALGKPTLNFLNNTISIGIKLL